MRALLLGAAAALLCAGPVWAANVTFSGTLGVTCTLALATPGTLALSADGTTLGSEQSGGVPAVLTVISIGTNTVTVNPPTLSATGSYDPSGQHLEASYTGIAGLSGVSHGFSASPSSFQTALTAALQVDNHAINPHGFAAGTYTMQTVVTCS